MTPAVKFLLIANTAVFVVQTLLGAVTDYQLTLDFGLVPPLVLHEFYIWQLFTYQFLHGGLFHLLFNMLARVDVRLRSGAALGQQFFSALLFYLLSSAAAFSIRSSCPIRWGRASAPRRVSTAFCSLTV